MRQIESGISNENGSVIVIAIMVLALMTIIGFMSTNTSITESFIVRNAALHKQNVYLAEAAVMEGLQDVLQLSYPDETNAQLLEANAGTGTGNDVSLWLNSDDGWSKDSQWYSQTSGRVLDPADTNIFLKTPVLNSSSSAFPSSILTTRGEINQNLIQMALVGWQAASSGGQTSLKATGPVRRSGRILAEYMSSQNGMVRLEIGLERIF